MSRLGMPLAVLATTALGLSAGAMLTEAVLFVGYWRSLPAEEFLAWFHRCEPALVVFFGALQTASLLLTLLAVFAHAFPKRPGFEELTVAAALSIVVIALYLAYFENINTAFVTGTFPVAQVPDELRRWGAWQWVRTGVGCGAFVMALLAVRRQPS